MSYIHLKKNIGIKKNQTSGVCALEIYLDQILSLVSYIHGKQFTFKQKEFVRKLSSPKSLIMGTAFTMYGAHHRNDNNNYYPITITLKVDSIIIRRT